MTGGVLFSVLNVYFQLKDPLVLILITTLLVLGVGSYIAGRICKIAWKRKYVGHEDSS